MLLGNFQSQSNYSDPSGNKIHNPNVGLIWKLRLKGLEYAAT